MEPTSISAMPPPVNTWVMVTCLLGVSLPLMITRILFGGPSLLVP